MNEAETIFLDEHTLRHQRAHFENHRTARLIRKLRNTDGTAAGSFTKYRLAVSLREFACGSKAKGTFSRGAGKWHSGWRAVAPFTAPSSRIEGNSKAIVLFRAFTQAPFPIAGSDGHVAAMRRCAGQQ
jgi:hypothetical protein